MSRPHWPEHFTCYLAHDLFRKPVSTFRDHALGGTKRPQERRACHENILDLTSGAGDRPRRDTGLRRRARKAARKTGARRATRGRQRRAAAAAVGFLSLIHISEP